MSSRVDNKEEMLYPSEVKKLFRNRVLCLHCNDIITSEHRHDFKQCKCGKCFVDGGTDYRRRGGDKDKDWTELSTYKSKKELW